MTNPKFRTVLVGAGRIADGYGQDETMRRHYEFASHAQVLGIHPSYEWGAVADLRLDAAESTARRWHVPIATDDIEDVANQYAPEVAVLAIPPGDRLETVKKLPGLRAVLVEKPLGRTLAEAKLLLDWCEHNGIALQVNLPRRSDEVFRRLAEGQLSDLIGTVQTVSCVYGNGLLNNGTHMVDFVRMLVGEFIEIQAFGAPSLAHGGRVIPAPPGEVDVFFVGRLEGGASVAFHPLEFENYRENGLNIWGTQGRLSILLQGLSIQMFPRVSNRVIEGEFEVAPDKPELIDSSIGRALWETYSNLAHHVRGDAVLYSPGDSALVSATVVDAVFRSSASDGMRIAVA